MLVSSVFNRKFHAMLGDVISSSKTMNISFGNHYVKIDASKIDIEGLKILFKVLDTSYPRSDNEPSAKKTILSPSKINKLYGLCGYPKSMTDLSSLELSAHMEWIQFICAENNIQLQDQEWDALLKKAENYDK